jgi:hypothetical protein
MMTFDLFHTPADDGSYELSINESPPLHFSTPGAALGYAVKLANQRHQQGLDYAINIEGGDGRWRLFEGWRRLRLSRGHRARSVSACGESAGHVHGTLGILSIPRP